MNDIITQLTGTLPAKYITVLTVLFVASQAIGRIYHAVVSGGGLKAIFEALWLGTNTPKQP